MRHIELPTLKWRFLWHRIISKMICRVCCSLQYVRKMNDTLKCWALIVNWDRCNVAFFFLARLNPFFYVLVHFFGCLISKWLTNCRKMHVIIGPSVVAFVMSYFFRPVFFYFCLFIFSLFLSVFKLLFGDPQTGPFVAQLLNLSSVEGNSWKRKPKQPAERISKTAS